MAEVPDAAVIEAFSSPKGRALAELRSQITLLSAGLGLANETHEDLQRAFLDKLAYQSSEDIKSVLAGLALFAAWSQDGEVLYGRRDIAAPVATAESEVQPTERSVALPEPVLSSGEPGEETGPSSSDEATGQPERAEQNKHPKEVIVSETVRTLFGSVLNNEALHMLAADAQDDEESERLEKFLTGLELIYLDGLPRTGARDKSARKLNAHVLRLLQNVRNKEIAAEENTSVPSVHSYNNNLKKYLRIGKDEQVRGLFDLLYGESDEDSIAQQDSDETLQDDTEGASFGLGEPSAANAEQETAEAAAAPEGSVSAEALQQLQEGEVVSLRRETEQTLVQPAAPAPQERSLREEPLHVQTAHRFTQLIAAERGHTIALQEFLNPKTRGDLTVNKREIVKRLQADIEEYLNACEDSDQPSKHQIALLRGVFDLTFKHAKWRCGAEITPLGTFLSSLRSNGGSVNLAEIENELHAVLASVMDYREQSLEQPA